MEIRIPAKRTWLPPFYWFGWLAWIHMGGVFRQQWHVQSYEAGKP